MSKNKAMSNRARVERYFEMVQSGDPGIGDLFCDDIVWVAPQSSPVGRRHEGKAAVLALMGTGIDLYDMSRPMQIETEAVAAEGDRVFVEMTLSATSLGGEPYENHYVFVFLFREDRIAEIHEHLDTLYTQKRLFDPIGRTSPLDAPAEDSR
jgi:ketosteroid isomerase-like protein